MLRSSPIEAASSLSDRLMPLVRDTAREAGAMAAALFRPGEKTAARIWSKAGGSPVTEADVAVDAFLKVRLSQALPEAGWLSEETTDDPARLDRRIVWIVDPIDGTRAFMSGHPDWSVAIALLVDGEPALGLVHAPAHGLLYEAAAGGGALRNGAPIAVSAAAGLAGAAVAGPRPLIDHLERAAGAVRRLDRIPSLALRLVRVADGAVDIGLVSSNARDWDIAAADLILVEAGGRLTGFDGRPPRYNQPEPIHGELVATSRRLHPPLIEAMTARRQPAAAPS
jgi:myo-inositol-1(or 4)-monophosphatase